MNLQPANVPSAAPPPQRIPTPMAVPQQPPQPKPRFREPQAAPAPAPFGTGSFETVAARRPARRGIYGLLAVAVAAAVAMVFWYNNSVKPGHIELTITPADATVVIDNVKVGDHSPLSIEKTPGPYTLSVTRDGYARSDQSIELKAGQPLALTVTLEPSPDTGFELTSDPPGGLVWLDSAAVKEANGQQARTNFRASRIAPGHHVLEIRGDRFKPWQQDVEIEPSSIRKVHAILIPAVGGGSSGGGSAKPAPIANAPAAGGGGKEQLVNAPPSNPVAVQQPPSPSKPSGGGATTNAATGAGMAAGGGAIASAPATPRRKKVREAPPDDTNGDAFADEAPAPKKSRETPRETVSSDDSPSGGSDCSITINSIPWSEVWIDGKNTTKHTPVVDLKVPCGKHKLAFKRPDMQIDQTESINVKPGQAFKQRYTLATGED
jgi:hypothetical protein